MGRTRRRMTAPALALLLAACATAPTPPSIPQPTSNASPLGSPPDISAAAIAAHVRELDEIAAANGGVRAVGTAGYAASVEYVRSELEAMGYTVSMPTVEMTVFRELPGATVEIEGGMSFEAGRDFRAMIYSAGGDIRGSLVEVGVSNRRSAGGCRVADWKEFPEGAIALVPPASCHRRLLVMHAQAAGAAAIIANDGSGRGSALRPTLEAPDITIPALASTWPMAVALHYAAIAEADVHIHLEVTTEQASVASVVAETGGSDPSRVAMLGAHLDSVHDGPGINDDGSGVAALLEIARAMVAGRRGRCTHPVRLLGRRGVRPLRVAGLRCESRRTRTSSRSLPTSTWTCLALQTAFRSSTTFPGAGIVVEGDHVLPDRRVRCGGHGGGADRPRRRLRPRRVRARRESRLAASSAGPAKQDRSQADQFRRRPPASRWTRATTSPATRCRTSTSSRSQLSAQSRPRRCWRWPG